MTAIAAVLALSSTSLIAQTVAAPAEPTPTVSAPVITPAPVTPAAPMAVAPAVSDPLAPSTSPIAEATTEPITQAPAPVKSIKSVSKTSIKTAKSAPAVKSVLPVTTTNSPEVAKTTPVSPVAETTPIAAAPVAPVPPTIAEATPPQSTTTTVKADEVLPIAGAAGAGLLALAGLGVAVRRRKRDEDEFIVDEAPVLETSHEQIVEPTFARAPVVGIPAVASMVEDDEFHDDFDLSKYGPNVQAAYRGPTADNPSLSLRKRLKRGAALDQMARNAEAPMASTPHRSSKPVGATNSFMLRPSPLQTNFRPVLQS